MYKFLGYLLSPLPLAVILILFGTLVAAMGAIRWGRTSQVCGVFLLLICSMPAVEWRLKNTLQQQYPAVPIQQLARADLIVVPGGAVAMPFPPRLEVELRETSDRVLHAFRLYRAGKAPRILLSGGNVYDNPEVQPESEYIKELLIEWGVPRSVIAVEGDSRTTWENAAKTMEYLTQRGNANARVLLVTSAIHMPRSIAVFRDAGVNVEAATTDVGAQSITRPGIYQFLPSVDALSSVSQSWHEILGNWVYQAGGWLQDGSP